MWAQTQHGRAARGLLSLEGRAPRWGTEVRWERFTERETIPGWGCVLDVGPSPPSRNWELDGTQRVNNDRINHAAELKRCSISPIIREIIMQIKTINSSGWQTLKCKCRWGEKWELSYTPWIMEYRTARKEEFSDAEIKVYKLALPLLRSLEKLWNTHTRNLTQR